MHHKVGCYRQESSFNTSEWFYTMVGTRGLVSQVGVSCLNLRHEIWGLETRGTSLQVRVKTSPTPQNEI